jgi:4'-phosphopantetheinyl transferase
MPAADEVHVFVLRLDGGASPRERRVEARRRLRGILAGVLGVGEHELEVLTGNDGKPELATATPRFNLSHSGEVALVALTRDRDVGIDVERIDPRRDVGVLAERALGDEGAAAVLALPPAERAGGFHRAWARREAVAKCAGTGLSTPPPEAPRQVVDLDVSDGYAAAVSVDGAVPVRVVMVPRAYSAP